MQSGRMWHFDVNTWLLPGKNRADGGSTHAAATKDVPDGLTAVVDAALLDDGNGSVTSVTRPAISEHEISTAARVLLTMKRRLRDVHLYISVFWKPPRHSFTRCQRLACAFRLVHAVSSAAARVCFSNPCCWC